MSLVSFARRVMSVTFVEFRWNSVSVVNEAYDLVHRRTDVTLGGVARVGVSAPLVDNHET